MRKLLVSLNYFADNVGDILQKQFDALRNRNGIEVQMELYDWGNALSLLNGIASHKRGPVVSHIGTTWMGSLVAEWALRPFSERDVKAVGGSAAFFPASWQTTRSDDEAGTYSIPWLADTNVMYYRKDAFEKARIDPKVAFSSLDHFSQAIQTLHESGHPLPWAAHNGVKTLSMVHHIANWIWGSGGEFISSNGKSVEFNSPAARAGIRKYFELQRFIPPSAYHMTDDNASHQFFHGNAAVVLTSPHYIQTLNQKAFSPEVVENTDIVVPPGVPFIGGSNWIIWKHISSLDVDTALAFISFMTSTETLLHLYNQTGLLPARLDALRQTTDDPHYLAVMETLQKGRPLPSRRLWGLIESRLTDTFSIISNALIANPDANIDSILDQHLSPLEMRLNHILQS